MPSRLTVPFLDLKSQYRQHQAAFDDAMGAVIAEAAFVGGPWVEQFEAEFAAYCGTTHAVGVANGTVALWMALLAMGIGPGDEVITVPSSFIATAEAISFCGAKPVFVDIQEADCNMDPALLKAAISSRTKAILPVHLFGHPANMEAILAIAQEHG
ncbi:MAG: aminotransferase class I/II-fold pyridoxal phosphate-dependent enzyme, partial [Verrucomicrobiaceae bacterium]